jgi:hypothetical protein
LHPITIGQRTFRPSALPLSGNEQTESTEVPASVKIS